MLRQMARKLRALSVESVPFDPSTLDDEIAMNTEWSPLQSGGASFRTHRLVMEKPNRIAFRATWRTIAFCITFVVMGLGMMTAALAVAEIPREMQVLLTLLGLVFAGGMGIYLCVQLSPNVFDGNRGFYSKGRFQRHRFSLDEIYALQLISEYCRGSEASYFSYELNLVLEDSRRINVVDHGDLTQLQADARTISQRINKPVWDATRQ